MGCVLTILAIVKDAAQRDRVEGILWGPLAITLGTATWKNQLGANPTHPVNIPCGTFYNAFFLVKHRRQYFLNSSLSFATILQS